jgi:hypothetical protein
VEKAVEISSTFSPCKLDPDTGTEYVCVMRIIAKRTLREFWEQHPDAEQPLQTWYKTTELAEWDRPADVKSY